jgi:hypothetical protein
VVQADLALSIVEDFDALPDSCCLIPSRTSALCRFFRPLSVDGLKLSAGLNFEPTLRADPARTQVDATLGHGKTIVSVAVLHATSRNSDGWLRATFWSVFLQACGCGVAHWGRFC